MNHEGVGVHEPQGILAATSLDEESATPQCVSPNLQVSQRAPRGLQEQAIQARQPAT
jgi:hypothetical protein